MALARKLAGLRLANSSGLQQALFSAQAAHANSNNPYYDVPQGHKNSDLSQTVCNIGLSRRRDLTLRQDVRLTVGGESKTLADIFRGEKAVVVGLPDCGAVCSEKHIPSYLKQYDALRKEGVSKIFCVAVGDAAAADDWASKTKIDPSRITMTADTTGAFARQLGVEVGSVDAPGPRTLRYSAYVDDGTLLKLRVERNAAEVKETSAETMVDIVALCHGKRQRSKGKKI